MGRGIFWRQRFLLAVLLRKLAYAYVQVYTISRTGKLKSSSFNRCPTKPKKPYSCMISRKPSKVFLNPQPLRTLNPIKDPTTQRIRDPKLQRTSHPKGSTLITGSPSLTLRLERGFWAQRGVWGYFDHMVRYPSPRP